MHKRFIAQHRRNKEAQSHIFLCVKFVDLSAHIKVAGAVFSFSIMVLRSFSIFIYWYPKMCNASISSMNTEQKKRKWKKSKKNRNQACLAVSSNISNVYQFTFLTMSFSILAHTYTSQCMPIESIVNLRIKYPEYLDMI